MLATVYTNGVIAVREKSLLGEKLLRLAELSAEEAFRALSESGFGGEAKGSDGESLCRAEEARLDGFIREYAPSRAAEEYLLAPRDFHNMKALVKAQLLGTDADNMLAPAGIFPAEQLKAALESGDLSPLPLDLCEAARACLNEEEPTGAKIGAAFDKALFAHLKAVCKTSPMLKKLLAGRADRTNILIALRAQDKEFALDSYLAGGKLKTEQLAAVFEGNWEALKGTPYADFYKCAAAAKEAGKPFTEAERALGSFEAEYFAAHKYELAGKEPFLYYVFRRRAEIANVRILLVCLNAGLPEQEIKKRLRTV